MKTIQRNVILSFLLLIVLELALVLYQNQGTLVYVLDDPYIHLRLAEMISRYFTYGINPNEFSAPSSSILWPLLLTPFARLSFFNWMPFLINAACSIGTLIAFLKIIHLCIPNKPPILIYFFSAAFILATNLVGLVFTGMEHSLQVMLCTLIMYAFLKTLEQDAFPRWGAAVIILAPLVRYELTGFSLLITFFLIWHKDYKTACWIISALILSLGSFTLFLYINDHILLPNSIASKTHWNFLYTHPTQAVSLSLMQQMHQFFIALYYFPFIPAHIALYLFLLVFAMVNRRKSPTAIWVSGIALLVLLSHLFLGKYGYFDRYHVYLSAIILPALLYCFKDFIAQAHIGNGIKKYASQLLMVLTIFTLYFSCFTKLFIISTGSHSIYAQQYQMSRLVAQYCPTITAVNDIGLVSYHNSQYVFDLMGLGNTEALRLRLAENSTGLKNLLAHHKVKLIMFYISWFPAALTADWIPLGQLTSTEQKNRTTAESSVQFYAANKEDVLALKTCLKKFSAALPKDDKFIFTTQ
jgi:hypothetical protein